METATERRLLAAQGALLDQALELLRMISRRYESQGLPDDPMDAVREFLAAYDDEDHDLTPENKPA